MLLSMPDRLAINQNQCETSIQLNIYMWPKCERNGFKYASQSKEPEYILMMLQSPLKIDKSKSERVLMKQFRWRINVHISLSIVSKLPIIHVS